MHCNILFLSNGPLLSASTNSWTSLLIQRDIFCFYKRHSRREIVEQKPMTRKSLSSIVPIKLFLKKMAMYPLLQHRLTKIISPNWTHSFSNAFPIAIWLPNTFCHENSFMLLLLLNFQQPDKPISFVSLDISL